MPATANVLIYQTNRSFNVNIVLCLLCCEALPVRCYISRTHFLKIKDARLTSREGTSPSLHVPSAPRHRDVTTVKDGGRPEYAQVSQQPDSAWSHRAATSKRSTVVGGGSYRSLPKSRNPRENPTDREKDGRRGDPRRERGRRGGGGAARPGEPGPGLRPPGW